MNEYILNSTHSVRRRGGQNRISPSGVASDPIVNGGQRSSGIGSATMMAAKTWSLLRNPYSKGTGGDCPFDRPPLLDVFDGLHVRGGKAEKPFLSAENYDMMK